jgi:hypothetical protein
MDGFVHRRAEEDDAADLVLDDVAFQILKEIAFLIDEPRVDADLNELPDLFFDRHFLEHLIRRLPRFFGRFEFFRRLTALSLRENQRIKD